MISLHFHVSSSVSLLTYFFPPLSILFLHPLLSITTFLFISLFSHCLYIVFSRSYLFPSFLLHPSLLLFFYLLLLITISLLIFLHSHVFRCLPLSYISFFSLDPLSPSHYLPLNHYISHLSLLSCLVSLPYGHLFLSFPLRPLSPSLYLSLPLNHYISFSTHMSLVVSLSNYFSSPLLTLPFTHFLSPFILFLTSNSLKIVRRAILTNQSQVIPV